MANQGILDFPDAPDLTFDGLLRNRFVVFCVCQLSFRPLTSADSVSQLDEIACNPDRHYHLDRQAEPISSSPSLANLLATAHIPCNKTTSHLRNP